MRINRLILFVILLNQGTLGFSQTLNKLGKIEVYEIPTLPEYRIERLDGTFKILKDSFLFEGNTFFETSKGFVTSLQVVDNQKDFIKLYDPKGSLTVTILSDKIINLKVSELGNKIAFNNSEHIIQINTNNFKIDTLADSYVYEFVKNEELIYYNPENKSIYYKNLRISSEQYPNQFIDYKGRILVITKQYIYELVGNSLFQKYEFKGSFFDAKIVNEEFYFVDKEEKRKSEIISLYKTSDFNRVMLVDRNDDLNK